MFHVKHFEGVSADFGTIPSVWWLSRTNLIARLHKEQRSDFSVKISCRMAFFQPFFIPSPINQRPAFHGWTR